MAQVFDKTTRQKDNKTVSCWGVELRFWNGSLDTRTYHVFCFSIIRSPTYPHHTTSLRHKSECASISRLHHHTQIGVRIEMPIPVLNTCGPWKHLFPYVGERIIEKQKNVIYPRVQRSISKMKFNPSTRHCLAVFLSCCLTKHLSHWIWEKVAFWHIPVNVLEVKSEGPQQDTVLLSFCLVVLPNTWAIESEKKWLFDIFL